MYLKPLVLWYPVSEVYNGGYTISTCTTTSKTKTHSHLSAVPLWNYLEAYKSTLMDVVPSKHYQTTTSPCGFEDIRSDPNYVSDFSSIDQFGRAYIYYWFPSLNTQYREIFIAYPNGQVYPLREFPMSVWKATPMIPTAEVYDVIATLWQDYQGLADFGTLTRGDDLIIQWTDLKISDDAVVSTQLTLHPNGDFKIRTGRCQGDDFGLLDGAVSGYQATDGSGQKLFKTLSNSDPCNVAVDFKLNYKMRYVDQVVSDWFVVGDLQPFSAEWAAAEVTLSAVEYGALVPVPQGEQLFFHNDVLYQASVILGKVVV